MRGRPGKMIAGRYRLTSKVGQGGMGGVWLAHDEVLDRRVALKEIVLPHGDASEDRAKLRRRAWYEAVAAARLQHSGIVRIYDVVKEDGDPWIVMEYIAGRSLADLIQGSPEVLTERYIAEIGLRVLDALCVAHAAGVLHRDVKPANILIGRTPNEVMLADFGIATIEGHSRLTRDGSVIGTVAYMAPERFKAKGEVGPASDMWSLGATLYTAVQGHSPYHRDNDIAIMGARLSEDEAPEPLTGAHRLRPVIERLLIKDPRARMRADEAARLLGRIVAGSTSVHAGARPSSRTEPPKSDPGRSKPEKPDPGHRKAEQPIGPGEPAPAEPDGRSAPLSHFAVMAAEEPTRAVMIMARMGPRAAGGVLDDMASETTAAARMMSVMPTEYAAGVLDHAQTRTAAAVLLALPPSRAAEILVRMAHKPAGAVVGAMSARIRPTAAVVRAMPEAEAGRVFNNVPQRAASSVLLQLKPQPAAAVLAHMAVRPAGTVVETMSAEVPAAAAVVRAMPIEQAGGVLTHTPPGTAASILSVVEASWATQVLAEMDQPASVQVVRHLNRTPST
ncbi:protein kinase domain-containing protein [Actinoallomurus sp. CA-150999]|uniref:protein kinase domain-containing protein n=1 Tax=Actinoallomurus sp. CA-150999 TaxID=3239887 RepID=UPI003D94A266